MVAADRVAAQRPGERILTVLELCSHPGERDLDFRDSRMRVPEQLQANLQRFLVRLGSSGMIAACGQNTCVCRHRGGKAFLRPRGLADLHRPLGEGEGAWQLAKTGKTLRSLPEGPSDIRVIGREISFANGQG